MANSYSSKKLFLKSATCLACKHMDLHMRKINKPNTHVSLKLPFATPTSIF